MTEPAPEKQAGTLPSRQTRGARIVRWTGIAAAVFAGAVFVSAIAFLLALASYAPQISKGDLYALNRPPSLIFLDENDQSAGTRGSTLGQRLMLKDMPPYLPAAFIAAEDRRFYEHGAIDPGGMLRAAIVNLRAGHVVQGGSTITQQLVKMLFLYPDRTFTRKLREMAGAIALEQRLTKQQILELYLNRLYLGSGAYGVDAAAHVYFGKSARNVTVAQAAMLAALTRAPSAFSPRRDLEGAQDRANEVLNEMAEIGAITPQQKSYAQHHPAGVTNQIEDLARNYFLDAAAEEATQLVPSAHGDLIISTTMDPNLQRTARAQLDGVLDSRGRALHATQGALVSMTTDGAIRALLGGRDYAESSFNRVTHAHRQPGSAFKAFLYLAAFEHGLTPETVRVDQPVSIQDMTKVWTPDNYSQTYLGPLTLEQAFAKSINTVAVQLGQEVGINNVAAVAHQLGIQSPLDPVPSLALGTSDVTPLELTGAYASFATLGHRVQPYLVREIRSPGGTVLYRRPPNASPQVFSEQNALEMNDLLYQVVQEGTGRAAMVPGHEVAGKTGTSADYRDAWFIGFSPDLVTGVWIGNDDSSAMRKVTGGALPAQVWTGFMRVALQNSPATQLPRSQPVLQMPEVAQSPSDVQGEPGPFDGLGNFFGRLFGSSPSQQAAPPPPPERNAQGSANLPFFTDRNRSTGAPAPTPNDNANINTDGGNTNANSGSGNSSDVNTFDNTGADQPPPASEMPRYYRRAPTPPRAPPASRYAGPPDYPMPPPPPYGNRGYGYASPYDTYYPPLPSPPPQRYRPPPPSYYSPPPSRVMPPPQAYPPGYGGVPFGQSQSNQNSIARNALPGPDQMPPPAPDQTEGQPGSTDQPAPPGL